MSLIFAGLLAREIARRKDIRLNCRAAGAAGYLGLGFGVTSGRQRSPMDQIEPVFTGGVGPKDEEGWQGRTSTSRQVGTYGLER